MKLFALDTATEACSCALLVDGEISGQFEVSPRGHTQRILPMVDELLQAANIKLSDLDALAFGRGPGGFTGVRVGAGIAQGLAFGAGLPVLAVSNLTAMAEAARQTLGATEVLALIDARMNEVYFSQLCYEADRWVAVCEEQVCAPEQTLAQCDFSRKPTVVGTGWAAYPAFEAAREKVILSDITLPDARYMLTLAEKQWQAGEHIDALAIEPVYLRNEVTWKKLPGRE